MRFLSDRNVRGVNGTGWEKETISRVQGVNVLVDTELNRSFDHYDDLVVRVSVWGVLGPRRIFPVEKGPSFLS
jgi:hypothetical protein